MTNLQNTTTQNHSLADTLTRVAREMVERDGPEQVSLRKVAKAVGVSQAAPYHHFRDKRAMLAAVATNGFREMAASMREQVNHSHSPRERLSNIGQCYVCFAVKHPLLFRLMQGPLFHAENSKNVDAALLNAQSESAALLIEAIKACMPTANTKQIMAACAASWSIVHGMATLCIDGRLETLININNIEQASKIITGRIDLDSFTEQTDLQYFLEI